MQRTWLCCVLVALLGLAGVFAWLGLQEPPVAPVPPVPSASQLPAGPAGPAGAGAEVVAAPPAMDETDAAPQRAQARLGPAADERVAELEVQVHQEFAGEAQALADLDVVLRVGGDTTVARTDQGGVARFSVAGGHGLTARVACGLGATAEQALSADAPVHVELVVKPRVLVRGRVQTADGQRIAHAALMLLPWHGFDQEPPAPLRVGRSLADGSFTLGLAAGGRLGANHPSHGPSAMVLVQVPARARDPLPVVPVELVLLGTAAEIRGTVRDASGQPVAGAELEFRAGGAKPGSELTAVPQRVRSDARGAYRATRLAPGEVVYGARARGHGPATGTCRLQPGESLVHDVVLGAPCTLVGTVRDEDGRPVAGAMVTVGPAEHFASVRQASDAEGTFRLVDLPAGSVLVTAATAATSVALPRRAEQRLELAPGRATEWHAVVRGDQEPKNLRGALVDAQARPLAGWSVVARPPSGRLRSAKTSAEGAFALAVAPGQRIDLRAYAPHQQLSEFAAAVLRSVDPAASPVRFVVTPAPLGELRGQVQSPEQAPLPATVSCWHHERNEYVRLAARGDGTLLAEVPAGTLDLVVEHPGYASAARRELVIAARQRTDLGVIQLGAGGGLSGAVRGPDGLPPEQVELLLVADGQRFAASYRAGSYRFPTVPAGSYRLLVQARGLAAVGFDVAIAAGVDAQQDVELRAGITRTFRIEVPADAPGTVGLGLTRTASGMQWLAVQAAAERAPGAATAVEFIACMAPGAYEAVAWAGDRWKAKASVPFAAGDAGVVTLRLARE